MKNVSMALETDSEKWLDFAKIIALCIAPYFLIKNYIDKYFKDKALEREAALQVLINQTIDTRVTPEIKRLADSVDKLRETVSELQIKANNRQ